MHAGSRVALSWVCLSLAGIAAAGVGDPQVKTDHPWYPGELAMSTFERLAATQAEVYARVTGRPVATDEERALASWFWRNLHYAHCEEGRGDYFDEGFEKAEWNREYWHGLFAHGFALCGTTHSQWAAEMDSLLGQCRARGVGVSGHSSFEVFLTGGPYGSGRWALLDHDLSTVIFDESGARLLSIAEILERPGILEQPGPVPGRQRGWRVAGLHRDDAGVFDSLRSVSYFPGYAGPPPVVHLRSGESLRRYPAPGLEDGETFVFWGLNKMRDGIPGPERDRTWVNQPEKMFGAESDAGSRAGRARFGNAVYTYRPDFSGGAYREGVIHESADQVTFEFYTPYVIAATPPNESEWGIYEDGCRNGLILDGEIDCIVSVSTDRGTTWHRAGATGGSLDLTDSVKGHQQYWLRFEAGASDLAGSGLVMRTVCQLNPATVPRLRDGKNRITYLSSGRALASAGPNRDQALAQVVEGSLDKSAVTLELAAPRGEKIVGAYAASHNRSGNPPPVDLACRIDYSIDGGRNWEAIAKDWRLIRREPEPSDLWSQSFTYGSVELPMVDGPVRIRFDNNCGKTYRRVEGHLAYAISKPSRLAVTFAWAEGDAGGALRTERNEYSAEPGREDSGWVFDAGENAETRWVEFAAE